MEAAERNAEKHINQLLKDVRRMIVYDRAERFRQGKEFNIFRVQRILNDEVKICRLIRELLDPKGSHGQGSVFLRLFLETLGWAKIRQIAGEDYDKATVAGEVLIKNDRRIDLLIRIGKYMLPIEAKVYATDQEWQCSDYYNFAVSYDPDVVIYYLTPDGHEPSDSSKNGLKDAQIQCISFAKEIIDWLTTCIKADALEQIHPVREILIQFREILKQLTGKEEGKVAMEIMNQISSSRDNFEAAEKVASVLAAVKAEKMIEIFDHIKHYMDQQGYSKYLVHEAYRDEANQYYKSKKLSWPSLNYCVPAAESEIGDKIALRFEIGTKLYFGIVPWDPVEKKNWKPESRDGDTETYVFEPLMPVKVEDSNNKHWYWMKYIAEEIDFWTCNNAYKELYDRRAFQETIESVFAEIADTLEVLMKA
ncbi:hypothetical protein HMPREF9623_01766 [Stomatobaculum longum]|uniref:PD-(D/E)XK nuclease superfamily protein n=1 Tax=Stomatobaculum longum TaxID=796942 RepID=A0AA36Y3M8_9FIRM|nr:PD-(D/E)XK nuclease family protein [Stomatobaculum longum]EHO15855.1 hypothetical protein HMPREF9623_01766 [Stomatobaculum longum]